MSNFGDLSIFHGSTIAGGSSSQDKDDQSFDKWMQQTRNSQSKQRTPGNGNTAANQDPSTLKQDIIEAERFSRESSKNNTSYIFYKRVVAPSRPESESLGGEEYDKKSAYTQSQVKLPGSARPEVTFSAFLTPVEEEIEQKNEQALEEEESNAEEPGLPQPRDSLQRISRESQEPDNQLDEEETDLESEEENLPSARDTLKTPFKITKENDSDSQKNDSDDSDDSNADSPNSLQAHHNYLLLPIHGKKESDKKNPYRSQQEVIADSLGIDPKNLSSSALTLLMDEGPLGRMTRAIIGFCINDAIHSNGVWQTYVAIDQKILAETTLFLHLTQAELLLRFKTTNRTSSKRIQENEKNLEASISAVLETKGYPHVIQIFLED